jgi:hypothetical protein
MEHLDLGKVELRGDLRETRRVRARRCRWARQLERALAQPRRGDTWPPAAGDGGAGSHRGAGPHRAKAHPARKAHAVQAGARLAARASGGELRVMVGGGGGGVFGGRFDRDATAVLVRIVLRWRGVEARRGDG